VPSLSTQEFFIMNVQSPMNRLPSPATAAALAAAPTDGSVTALIDAYHSGRRRFLAMEAKGETKAVNEDALWHDMCHRHFDRLINRTPAIETLDEVVALLNFITADEDSDFDEGVPLNVVAAIADYFERHPGGQAMRSPPGAARAPIASKRHRRAVAPANCDRLSTI
jgi:hypothetical protein